MKKTLTDRRSILMGLLLSAGALVFLPARSFARAVIISRDTAFLERLGSVFSEPKSAHAVGKAYLESFPEENSRERLFQSIFDASPGWLLRDQEYFHQNLRAKIRNDFELDQRRAGSDKHPLSLRYRTQTGP